MAAYVERKTFTFAGATTSDAIQKDPGKTAIMVYLPDAWVSGTLTIQLNKDPSLAGVTAKDSSGNDEFATETFASPDANGQPITIPADWQVKLSSAGVIRLLSDASQTCTVDVDFVPIYPS